MHTPARFVWPARLLFAVALLGWAAAACGDGPLGAGIGLPPFSERPAQGPSHLVLTRAYIPPPGSTAAGFVELYNGSGTALDLSRAPLTLESQSGSVTLSAALWAANTTLSVSGATFDALQLHAQAGELVLLDANLVVNAYGAWGNDPNQTRGSFAALAQASGQGAPWRALPYPLADNQAISLDAGRPTVTCSDANIGAAYPPAALTCAAGAPAQVWISRVVAQGLDGNGSAIELYNPGSAPVDIWGLQLCRSDGSCDPLYPYVQTPNEPLATILAAATTPALGAADAARRRLSFVDGQAIAPGDLLSALVPVYASDELALAPPGEVGAAMSYVRLQPQGSATQPPSLGAPLITPAQAQAWQTGLLTPRIAGESLALAVGALGAPSAPSAWRTSALPFDTSLVDPNAPWDACSQPMAPAAPSVVLDQLVPWDAQGTLLVALYNLSSQSVAPSTSTLVFGAQEISLAAAQPLEPNATLWVALTPQASCDALGVSVDVCAPNQSNALASNEMALMEGTSLLSFVQWGAGVPAEHAPQAVMDHIWPTTACSVAAAPSFETAQRLVRLPQTPGQSPADFALARLLATP